MLKSLKTKKCKTFIIIDFLKRFELSKKELKEKVIYREKKLMGEFAHSESTFYYWLKRLREWNMVREVNSIVSLTKLGEWVSNASGDEFVHRFEFVEEFICNSCSSEGTVVIFKPIIESLHISKENSLNVKAKCPVCKKEEKIYIKNWKLDDFKNLYNNSIDNLKKFVNIKTQKI